jgi:hypothetical protein
MSEVQRAGPATKLSILKYWIEHADELGLEIVDFSNPNCFACGAIPAATMKTKNLEWTEKIRLQRAHIVPKSLGGSNDRENLLLLCDLCHKECPDINDRDLVLRWVRNRPECMVRFQRDLEDAFTQLGYPNWRENEYLSNLENYDHLGEGYAVTHEWTTHGAKLSVSTIVATVVKKFETSQS